MERQPLAKPAEVSAYIGVPEKTLTNWRHLGKGPKWTKVEKAVRYRWTDVEAWLTAQQCGGAAA